MKEFKLLIQDWLETVICNIESRPKLNLGDNDLSPHYIWESGIKQGKKEAFEEIIAQWPEKPVEKHWKKKK